MKTLVVYYSKTGITKKIAENISMKLRSDIEEIIDKNNRQGIINLIQSTFDALFKKKALINEIIFNKNKYDLIVIGTPVWSWNITPAVRTYITDNADNFNNVAFFCTMGTNGDIDSFNEMNKLCMKEPIAKTSFTRKEVIRHEYNNKIDDFIKRIIQFYN